MFAGRWRVDHCLGTAGLLQPIEWFATEEAADVRLAELRRAGVARAVAWWWTGEYRETVAEEAARTVRDQLTERIGWLKLDQGDAA